MIIKQTLVLVPGLDGTGDLFKPLLQEVPPEVDIVIIEYPRDKILSQRELVNVICKQIPNDKSIVILAESFAGILILSLLKYHQFNLKGIVFCATFARNPRKTLLNLMNVLPLSYLLHLPIPDALIKYFCVGTDASEELVNLIKKAIKTVNPKVLADRLQTVAKIDESKFIRRLENIPCRFIQALDDKLVSKQCLNDFVNNIPDLKVTNVSGPHFILQAKPRECWEIIKDFYEKQIF